MSSLLKSSRKGVAMETVEGEPWLDRKDWEMCESSLMCLTEGSVCLVTPHCSWRAYRVVLMTNRLGTC